MRLGLTLIVNLNCLCPNSIIISIQRVDVVDSLSQDSEELDELLIITEPKLDPEPEPDLSLDFSSDILPTKGEANNHQQSKHN